MTMMLPTEDAAWVGQELARRFGLDALAVRADGDRRQPLGAADGARSSPARPKVLVFNYCYHGTVDETFDRRSRTARRARAPGNVGPPVDPAETTRVVEFNDVAALERGARAAATWPACWPSRR